MLTTVRGTVSEQSWLRLACADANPNVSWAPTCGRHDCSDLRSPDFSVHTHGVRSVMPSHKRIGVSSTRSQNRCASSRESPRPLPARRRCTCVAARWRRARGRAYRLSFRATRPSASTMSWRWALIARASLAASAGPTVAVPRWRRRRPSACQRASRPGHPCFLCDAAGGMSHRDAARRSLSRHTPHLTLGHPG